MLDGFPMWVAAVRVRTAKFPLSKSIDDVDDATEPLNTGENI